MNRKGGGSGGGSGNGRIGGYLREKKIGLGEEEPRGKRQRVIHGAKLSRISHSPGVVRFEKRRQQAHNVSNCRTPHHNYLRCCIGELSGICTIEKRQTKGRSQNHVTLFYLSS